MRTSRLPIADSEDDEATVNAGAFSPLARQNFMKASRRSRVSSRGLYAPTPAGQAPRRRILGVDPEQARQSAFDQSKSRDDFMARYSPKPKPPAGSVSVQGGGHGVDPDSGAKPQGQVIRYGGNPDAGRNLADEPENDDEAAAPAKPGYETATPPGVDPVRTSKKPAGLSAFGKLKKYKALA